MRVSGGGVIPIARRVEITVDGEPFQALEGETLAAALTAAGKLAVRATRTDARRGLFCGMGVCFECVMAVDGRQGIRACMTPVRPGMTVTTQDYAPTLAAGHRSALLAPSPSTTDGIGEEEVEVLVIGGGPAGLGAARAAALAGARVVLIDERPALGGQYFKQLAKTHAFAAPENMDRQFRAGHDLIREVEGLGVRVLSEATVWSVFPPRDVAVYAGERGLVFQARQLIIATGAYERGVPLPGWTLPGFMTTGAAQTLLRAYRVSPGRRVLVAGNGPLNIQVACELLAAGVEVAAVVEAAPRPGPAALPHLLTALWESPDLMRDGAAYLAKLRRAGVPLIHGHAVIEARGNGKVETAVIAPIDGFGVPDRGRSREFAVDAVCVGYGFLPSNDLSRPLGCRHRFDEDKDTLVAERNADCETTVAGIFVAGDCGGMGGSRVAQEQGFLAGLAAARNLGKTIPTALEAERTRRLARLCSHERFQKALWTLFGAPRLFDQLATADTVVCRCEEVTLGALRATLATGTDTIGGVKRQTRAGMGRCQGRYCGPFLARLADDKAGVARDEFSFFYPRPPIKAVPISAIAREHPG